MTTDQIQRLLNVASPVPASARLVVRRLKDHGLVETDHTAVAFYEPVEPLCSWAPGQPLPDFGALAWLLFKRWRDVPARRVTICWASARAARSCGGLSKFTARASQLEHDLGTAGVLVRLHETWPQQAAGWVGEDILRRDFAPGRHALKKVPDGAVVDGNRIVRVAEFGGQYDAERLRKFHTHFGKKHRIPYDLW